MPESLPHAEDASLYVLDLLDPEARRTFETELATSPELQRHVADLHTNVEALALSTPPSLPPAAVWNGIAQRIASSPAPVPADVATPVSLWAYLRLWLTNGWAVATILAVALVLTAAFPRVPAPSNASTLASDSPELGTRGPGSALTGSRFARSTTGSAGAPSDAGANARTPRAEPPSPPLDAESRRLQDRVRLLSEQVAMLTHVLAQRAVLPAGAAQLQVFRLVSSNALPETSETLIADSRRTGPTPSPGTPGATASTSDNTTGTTSGTTLASATAELPLALALAAARQFASLNSSQETLSAPGLTDSATTVTRNAAVSSPGITAPTAGSEVTPLTPEVPATQDSIQVLELAHGSGNSLVGGSKSASSTEASIVSSSDATAFGAYSPETGQGAIAFRLSVGSPESEVLQLWMTDPHSGLVQSVGFASLNPVSIPSQVVVLRFNADTAAFSNPAFMITREPAGGSIVPTGPIVAQPPPSTVFPPNP